MHVGEGAYVVLYMGFGDLHGEGTWVYMVRVDGCTWCVRTCSFHSLVAVLVVIDGGGLAQ